MAGHEKKTLSAAERDEAARAAWREQAEALDPADCVWVDEFGSHLGLTRTSARTPRGERSRGCAPRDSGRARTTITALTPDGLGPGLVLGGGVSTRAFEVYVEAILAATLRPGQIVITDTLLQHQSPRVREPIEARGATVWFLPSYSPARSILNEITIGDPLPKR